MLQQGESIRAVQEYEDMIRLRKFINETPIVGDSHALILARCLSGEYTMLELLNPAKESVGVAVYRYEKPVRKLHLIVVNAINELDNFRKPLLSWFCRLGAEKFVAVTKHNQDAMLRAVIKDLPVTTYTVLEVRLNGWG